MRIYLSGRISGNADAGVQFSQAYEEVKKQYPGADIFNPMGMLQLCDTIAMIPGWEESRGANREYGYAVGTGMQVNSL